MWWKQLGETQLDQATETARKRFHESKGFMDSEDHDLQMVAEHERWLMTEGADHLFGE